MVGAQSAPATPAQSAARFKPGTSANPGGKPKEVLDLTAFLSQAFDDQRKSVDQCWLELAYILPKKAIRYALVATKKELGALQQLVTAAAIAKDKRFPEEDSAVLIRIPARLLQGFQAAIAVKSPLEKSIACAVSEIAHEAKPLVGSLPKTEDCVERSTGSVPT